MAKKTEEVKAPETITGRKDHEFATVEDLYALKSYVDGLVFDVQEKLNGLSKAAEPEQPAEGFDELTLLKGRLLKLETQLGIKR